MRNDEFYKDVLDNLYDGVYIVDFERKIRYWNRSAEQITGFTAKEVVGSFCWSNILGHVDHKGKNLCRSGCPLLETIQTGRPTEAHVFLHHKLGHRVPVAVRVTPLRDDTGQIVGAVEVFGSNLAEHALREKLEQLEKIALVDPLTHAANQRYFKMAIQTRLVELASLGLQFGLIMVSIDDFSALNSKYGVGDEILKTVANTLVNNARSGDCVARWNRRFMLVMPHTKAEELASMAEKLRILIKMSNLRSGPQKVSFTASVGATMARKNDDFDSIVDRLNGAVRKAKALNGNNAVIE